MPVPQAVREQLKALLGDGDPIRYIVPAVYAPVGPNVMIVVSDAAITVVTSGYFSRERPKSVVGRYPRSTRLGPVDGMPPALRLRGQFYQVDDEYIAAVNAADAELDGDALPDDPLPDL
ncbi:MAG: hypothetical protein QOJ50_891 [Cryptosporangiaceae bacterium]|nr:hypothetical protein [Cryptosporangiaceae bacterium]